MGIYNCASTLREAIDSILAQTYKNWELILCDDGSTDNTLSIAEEYCKQDPERFILLKNEHNMGLNHTLNRCLSVATGEYIARMDGDDISLPERFAVQADFLNTHPQYALVSCPMIYFDEGGIWGYGKAIEIPQLRDFVFHAPLILVQSPKGAYALEQIRSRLVLKEVTLAAALRSNPSALVSSAAHPRRHEILKRLRSGKIDESVKLLSQIRLTPVQKICRKAKKALRMLSGKG